MINVKPEKIEAFVLVCPYCSSKAIVLEDFKGLWTCDVCEEDFMSDGSERSGNVEYFVTSEIV